MLTGLNSNTATNLQLGAGAVLKTKYTQGNQINDEWKKTNVLTATNGGITFNAVPNFFTPNVDGGSERIKELRYLVDWTVTATFTAVEVRDEVIKKSLGATTTTTGGAITGASKISPTDFADLYILAERGDGAIIQITMKNSLSTGGLSLTTANNGNGGIAVTITGHYSMSDLDTPPFEIETIVSA